MQEDNNEELFVMDKSETKAMEELFDKLVAEDSNLNQKPVVRSRSFDAIEKWLQNSSDPQTQTGKYHFLLTYTDSYEPNFCYHFPKNDLEKIRHKIP